MMQVFIPEKKEFFMKKSKGAEKEKKVLTNGKRVI